MHGGKQELYQRAEQEPDSGFRFQRFMLPKDATKTKSRRQNAT